MSSSEDKKIDVTSKSAKEELELQKLLLEIKQLEESWWKKPTYILAALPTVLAIGTLLVGIFTGYFQATALKLENQKHDLEVEVKQFASQKHELHHANQQLLAEREDLNLKIEQTRKNLEDIKDALHRLEARQDRLNESTTIKATY